MAPAPATSESGRRPYATAAADAGATLATLRNTGNGAICDQVRNGVGSKYMTKHAHSEIEKDNYNLT